MSIEVCMPAVSTSMTEGTLARWHKKEGEPVEIGEIIAEIETDKAIVDLEAEASGILAKIFVADGSNGVKVGSVIARIAQLGGGHASDTAPGSGGAGADTAARADAAPAPVHPHSNGTRRFASPLARRIAAERGVALEEITGSGPNGRIIKADVESHVPALAAPAPAMLPQSQPPKALAPQNHSPHAHLEAAATHGLDPAYDEVPHTGMRRVIAQRLSESKQQVPHFYLDLDCQIDALLALRAQLHASVEGVKLSVNDFLVKAAALALRQVPAANASWTESCVRMHRDVDISVAVATPGGLLTPVVRGADGKSLGAISAEVKALAERARVGKLLPAQYQGGTFTISNLGMYGVRRFSAIINPPQACILAVGAAEQRPIVRDGALAVGTLVTLGLSADHRVVDGAVAAEFLATLRKLLEAPLALLV
jgi:pyruvate dehydrogenase E2 component (dihydrolipoamide acetyltransferase)